MLEARSAVSSKVCRRQKAVRRQAEARFGALDATTLERIAHASTADLERWLDRMLSAASLEELMAD